MNDEIRKKIINMIKGDSFDETVFSGLLEGIDPNEPIKITYSFDYSLLGEAVDCNNLSAVKCLFEHGADPNIGFDEEYPLWNLQYFEQGDDLEDRYEIAKLFFKYGADPNLLVEGETLYDYVLFKVYNDDFVSEDDFRYLVQFYKLLVIYGGGGNGYFKPDISKVDPTRPDDYHVEFEMIEGEIYITGNLVDANGEVVAEL